MSRREVGVAVDEEKAAGVQVLTAAAALAVEDPQVRRRP